VRRQAAEWAQDLFDFPTAIAVQCE
jgi:hypothetical protein